MMSLRKSMAISGSFIIALLTACHNDNVVTETNNDTVGCEVKKYDRIFEKDTVSKWFDSLVLQTYNDFVDTADKYIYEIVRAVPRNDTEKIKLAMGKIDSAYKWASGSLNDALLWHGYCFIETTEIGDYLEQNIRRKNHQYYDEQGEFENQE